MLEVTLKIQYLDLAVNVEVFTWARWPLQIESKLTCVYK